MFYVKVYLLSVEIKSKYRNRIIWRKKKKLHVHVINTHWFWFSEFQKAFCHKQKYFLLISIVKTCLNKNEQPKYIRNPKCVHVFTHFIAHGTISGRWCRKNACLKQKRLRYSHRTQRLFWPSAICLNFIPRLCLKFQGHLEKSMQLSWSLPCWNSCCSLFFKDSLWP